MGAVSLITAMMQAVHAVLARALLEPSCQLARNTLFEKDVGLAAVAVGLFRYRTQEVLEVTLPVSNGIVIRFAFQKTVTVQRIAFPTLCKLASLNRSLLR
jgi:urea transporter